MGLLMPPAVVISPAANADNLVQAVTDSVDLTLRPFSDAQANPIFQVQNAAGSVNWFSVTPVGELTVNGSVGTSGQFITSQGAGSSAHWTTVTDTDSLATLTDVSLSGTAQGDILFRGASVWNNLAAGPDDSVLVSEGAGANPTWSAAFVITDTGQPSCPDSGSQTERFGAGATAATDFCTALGFGASAGSGFNQGSVAIGWNSTAGGHHCVGIGASVMAMGLDSVAIGQGANCLHNSDVAVGQNSIASGDQACAVGANSQAAPTSTALGYQALAFGARCVALGAYSVNTANNQWVAGSDNAPLTDCYFGVGVTSATPQSVTVNASGGSGTNIAGASLTLAGGKSTGSAAGGDVLIQTSPAGGAGSALNALVTIARFTGDSKIGFFTATPIARPSTYTLAGTATRTLPTLVGIDNTQPGSVYARLADIQAVEGVLRQLLVDLASTSGYGLLVAS